MRRLISATLLTLAAGWAAAGPFDGNYFDRENGSDEYYCGAISDGSAAEIRDDLIIFYETSCQLSNPVNVRGLDAQLYDAVCSGEGPVAQKRIMLMRLQNSDGIIVLTKNNSYDWANCSSGE